MVIVLPMSVRTKICRSVGTPELVATAQLWPTCIRVFEDSGDGLFHLEAAFGEKVEQTFIDVVYKSNHYDTLIGTSLLNPIAYGAEQLKQLGEIAERTAHNELAAHKEPETERKAPEQPAKPNPERKTPEKPAKPTAERKPPEQPVEPRRRCPPAIGTTWNSNTAAPQWLASSNP